MAEDAESDIVIRFVDENDYREISAKAVSAKRKLKKESPLLCCIELTVQEGNPYKHTEYSLRIIYNLQFEESNLISDLIYILLLVFYYSTKITVSVLLALLYKRPVSIDRRNFSFY